MRTLRRATENDLDFLVRVDLEDEGVTHSTLRDLSSSALAAHRAMIASFVNEEDEAA